MVSRGEAGRGLGKIGEGEKKVQGSSFGRNKLRE